LQYWPLGGTLSKTLRRTVGDSALYRYVQLNLHFDPPRLLARAFGAPAVASLAAARQRPMQLSEKKVIDHFLNNLANVLTLSPSSIVLLFHSDTYAIADPAAAQAQKDSVEVARYFADHARDLGCNVVEVEERFRSDYTRYERRLEYPSL
jgi:hypothetical protein